MNYFRHAFATLPRHESLAEIEPVLARLKSKGFTGIWVENNYTDLESLNDRTANAEFPGNWDLFNLFDLTIGKKRLTYLPYLKGLAELCRKQELAFCLSFWIPRVNAELLEYLRTHHPRAIGVSDSHLEKNVPCHCTCKEGEGLAVISEMIHLLFNEMPDILGIKVATEDNHALLCDPTCPNAHGTTRAEHAANLFSTIQSAIKAGNPKARLLLYPWFWREGYEEEILSRLEDDYLVVTKYESGSIQQLETDIPGTPIFDSSIVSEKPGVGFERWLKKVGAARIIDMVPLGTGIDDFFLANPPHPARVFRRLMALRKAGVRSFMDFECGGYAPGTAEEIVARFAAEECPDEEKTLEVIAAARSSVPAAQEHTRRGWELFDQGFGLLPIGLGKPEQAIYSGRIGFGWSLCIATPLLPHLIGGERRHEIHWFSPYNFFTPQSAPRLGTHFLRVLAIWQEAATELTVASALAPDSEAANRDALAAKAHALSMFSVVHWAMAPGLLDTNPEVFSDLLKSEIEITRRFAGLVNAHPWIWANHCWHPHQTPLSQRLGLGKIPPGTDAFAFKIRTMEAAL